MARILVVEDDASIALGLRSDFAIEGHDVDVARDGQTALARARSESYDLILLDVMLPRKDGFAVCRELRAHGIRTPIIMLTARSQEAEKVLGLGLGADDYVTKPFSPLELRARVQAVLRRTATEALDVYRFGDVEVDLTRGEVRRTGAAIQVSALEFKVLVAFIRRRGRLLTREQLLDAVWRPDASPTDRVIDNHIMSLRRKVEPDPEKPRYLVSVRGLGYRFDG